MNNDIQIRRLEFTIQSLLVRLADARFGNPHESASAVAAWSNFIDLPSESLSERAARDLEVEKLINQLTPRPSDDQL